MRALALPGVSRETPLSLLAISLLLVCGRSPGAVTDTQSISIKAGWNAVYLEVEPADPHPSEVFKGLPVDQVSIYFPVNTPVQFIQNPSSQPWKNNGWRTWYKSSRPESILSNLHAILPHRGYLVHATADTTLTVTGQVRFQGIDWVPNSFKLIGFQVDPSNAPTFEQFFAGSTAHLNSKIFKLDNARWREAARSERIVSGHAYWIYCEGGSHHQGPVQVSFAGVDRIDFGKTEAIEKILFRNLSDAPVTVTINNSGLPSRYASDELPGRTQWLDFSGPVSLGPLNPGAERVFRFTAERDQFTSDREDAILTISNGTPGIRVRIPVFAEKLSRNPSSITGLWMGNVTINRVGEISRQGGGINRPPTPAGGEFNMRVILHSGAGGVKLLKDVTIMRKKQPDQDGKYEVVLLTDDTKIPDFAGIVRRGDKLVGNRLSSVFYDFDGNELDLAGAIALGGTVSGTVQIGPRHPTNPFRHKYHRDHITGALRGNANDPGTLNPDPDGSGPTQPPPNGTITRILSLSFSGGDHLNTTPAPGTRLTGVYKETIYGVVGLEKGGLRLEGEVDLQLVSTIDTLNPAP